MQDMSFYVVGGANCWLPGSSAAAPGGQDDSKTLLTRAVLVFLERAP